MYTTPNYIYGKIQELQYLEIKSKSPTKSLIVFLHGLGGNTQRFLRIISKLNLPDSTYYIIPKSPSQPITINQNRITPAWYDIINLNNFGNESEQDIFQSTKLIHKVINTAEKIVPTNKIFLIGFSQGGAMALYSGLVYEKKLGGIACLSGHLPIISIFPKKASPQNIATKIFMAHGTLDNVISIKYAANSYKLLKELQYEIYWKEYPIPHVITANVLSDLRKWLLNNISK
ncbi:MAG: carboxylesterase [Legionellales bacterium]|nr:carboxylesterase [Legionellales bacterium]